MIDNCYLIGVPRVPENGMFDQSTATAIRAVEHQYFHGMASPKGILEPGSSLDRFLREAAADATTASYTQRLSNGMYGLAAVMVPRAAGGDLLTNNISLFLPGIVEALEAQSLNDTPMLLMTLATINAETADFAPVDEEPTSGGKYPNSSPVGTPNHHSFDNYDYKKSIGNTGAPDGDRYHGRGFIQLTGRFNYTKVGKDLGLDLDIHPDKANTPEYAGKILAQYLKYQESAIRLALSQGNLMAARCCVNRAGYGFSAFRTAFEAGSKYLHLNVALQGGHVLARKQFRHAK